jgi:hypothetical protein
MSGGELDRDLTPERFTVEVGQVHLKRIEQAE